MANSQVFNYTVNNFDDVVEHLDALWYEFNELIGALNERHQCGDPPNTCGFLSAAKYKRPAKKGPAKRPAKKKAKR